MTVQLHPHKAAGLFPSMSEDEYQALKSDISENGQREPIVVYHGQILDGRHRYRACTELGIEPRVKPWDSDESTVSFVTSQNLHRRHLSASQRAAIAVQAEEMEKAEKEARIRIKEAASRAAKTSVQRRARTNECSNPVQVQAKPVVNAPEIIPERSLESRQKVAMQFGTNPRYIQDAKSIRDSAPDLLEQVRLGKRTIPQVKQELRRRQKRAELETKAQIDGAQQATWEIRQGSCIDILPTLTDKPRLIFADPPYNIGIDYGQGKSADLLPGAEYMRWVEQWLTLCRDLLTDDGSMWILISDEYAGEYAVTLKRLGLTIRSWIIWYESFGVNCSRGFNRCSRHLFYCVHDPQKFVFNEEAVTRPSDRQIKYADKRAATTGKLWDSVWGIEPPIPRLTGTCHERVPDFPTQLPLKLLTPIVLCASDPGDLVLDPFNGSGTTGVAAIQNRRSYLGIEQSPQFAELATLRLKGVSYE